MRLDLVTLKVFVSVYEEKSLAKAAEREHIAPSAISKRLADLEHMLHVKLFERRATGMEPTAAGAALIHHVRIIMRNLTQLEAEMVDYSMGLRGIIRVFANTAAMVQYLPGDIRSFLAAHPLVRVDLEEATSPETLRAVADNNAEVGIYGDAAVAADLTVMPYREDPLVLLVQREHDLAGRRSIRFPEALEHEFVGTPKGSSIDTALNRASVDLGIPLRIGIRTSGFDAVSRMVGAGLGVAVIPELISRSYVHTLPVVPVRIEDNWARRQLLIAVRNREALSPAAAAFVDHLTGSQAEAVAAGAGG